MSKRRYLAYGAALAVAGAAVLALATRADLLPLPRSLDAVVTEGRSGADDAQVVDRHGEPLNVSFTGDWNANARVPLYEVPAFLRAAFIAAEDKRFYSHHGVDWRARLAALAANVANGHAVRGASTITEQVVRMLHPRPRTVWSRWLEGFEAAQLERRFSKSRILEFYLNQVPYASNRRGIAQAARLYFARDLDTLSRKEMLALAVLVRAPSRFDLRRDAAASEGAIGRLAAALVENGTLDADERDRLLAAPLELDTPHLSVSAPHFVRHARAELAARERARTPGRARAPGRAPKRARIWAQTDKQERSAVVGSATVRTTRILTTLDSRLQVAVQRMLDERLRYLAPRGANDGAALIVDHATGEVLAWVVAGGGDDPPATYIDAVTTPRQPGSALKPFLYALALDGDWTAAQIIDDAPLVESTSAGLHSYQNYSRRFYGPVTLRDALGNSLNIPAVKTVQHVGPERYLATLAALGFRGLVEHPDYYGDGIALGDGPVTLFELVQAYAALANGGLFRPLTVLLDDPSPRPVRRVFSTEAASLVANILSDSDARALEFGRDSVLAFPVQTAVKTGTSSDFHDAWAVGFDAHYAAGVWIGNLNRRPTDGVTGSIGPALLLRGIFAELARRTETRPLYLSPRLVRHTVCVPVPLSAEGSDGCVERKEWFLPGTVPEEAVPEKAVPEVARLEEAKSEDTVPEERMRSAAEQAVPRNVPPPQRPIRFRQPRPGLMLAYDPRLPAEAQQFELVLEGVAADDRVRWTIDGSERWARGPTLPWRVTRGDHAVAAGVWRGGIRIAEIAAVRFVVK